MAVRRCRVTQILACLVVVAIPLIPDPPAPVERAAELDTQLVRAAECRYRGITASFDELTRAYALTAYEGARLVGWEARPNPLSPDTETLVRGRFRVAGARSDSAFGGRVPEIRRRSGDWLDVTWKLNTLSSTQVVPHDDYARDALDVYRHTVDRLLARMVFLPRDAALRASPGGGEVGRLEAGTVLLREGRRGDWSRVRIPSDTTAGWVRSAELRPVYGEDEPDP